ncbi:MAG: adenosylcobinamide-GDP ribazoletransferase [Methanobacterium sp.]
MKSLNRILGLVSFSTILPLQVHSSIQEMSKLTWLWPLIGGFIGIIIGTLGFTLINIIHLPQLIAAGLIYSFAIWFTGFHHLDGLIDFGDGMMVHGDSKRRIEVMRDQRIGTGGLAYLFMVAIITFASIATIPAIIVFPILFISEISAKVGLVTCCTFSKPFEDGTGRFFINAMNMKKLLLILIITLFIGYLSLKTVGILGIIGGLAGGLIIAFVARKNFNKATGDVLGTSNEVSRMIALIIMILFTTGLII